jgi:hypothetical protein
MEHRRFHRLAAALLVTLATAPNSSAVAQTDNEKAANGPLPGDITRHAAELGCSQKLPTPGYFSSINGAELADAARSGLYPCVRFTGSSTGGNKVFAWRSQDSYQGVSFINNGKPGELYLTGGDLPAPSGPVAPGPFIAKADATTGAQIWRTYLDNANVSGHWIAVENLNILPNGNIVAAGANHVALLDGDTGRILRATLLPTGDAPVNDTNFKHVTIAPDGTLILKDQTRALGETAQGAAALFKGVAQGLKQPNSVIVAVDPNTLDILDHVAMPEPASVPHSITTFDGKTAIYVAAHVHAFRYFWDPASKKLSQDPTWVVSYLQPGQTDGTAPSIMGDWIVIQNNGAGSKVTASSVVAINQKEPATMTSIFPFGPLKAGEISFAPPKNGSDADNNMVYSQDLGVGKVAGIKLDPSSGAMTTAFIVDDRTTCLVALIGLKDKRVMVTSNQHHDFPFEPTMLAMGTGLYKEQVRWREAATGRLLAESDLFEPMSPNSLVTPGFGGRFYFPTDKGFIVLQVKGVD